MPTMAFLAHRLIASTPDPRRPSRRRVSGLPRDHLCPRARRAVAYAGKAIAASTASVAPGLSDAIGLPTQSVDPAGITTTHAYNGLGDLTSTVEGAAAVGSNPALNLTTRFTPDAVGNVIATVDPLGNESDATIDADRRPLLAIEPFSGTGTTRTAAKTTYDANGRVTQVDKGTSNTAETSFSALETTLTAFDPNGNKVQETILNGHSGSAALTVTQMSYDPLNRVICTAERENSAVFASSLPGACVQSANGPNGPDHITQLTYDLAGQKLLEQRGVGSSIPINYAAYSYSGDGNLLTILDANGNLTTNTYDGFNRLAQVNYPMPTLRAGTSNPGDLESYTYDASSNRYSLTKRDGTAIQFRYDALNRMTSKSFPSPNTTKDVSYGYDLAGRPTSADFSQVSGTPGVSWTYDAAGRRITETTSGYAGTTGGLGLSFTNDKAGNRTRITWPDSRNVTFAYDGANRFSSVSNAFFDVSAGYGTLSRLNALSRGLNQTSSTAISFDKADRMSQLSHVFTPASGNEASNVGYTPAGQVASATSTNAAYNWTPVLTPTVATVPDGLNRNASVGGVANSYDVNGNLTSDGTRTFAYDKENRLISESGPVTLALAYDPMGRLQQSVINGTTTQFLYDGSALVGEYDGSGNMLRRYVHGPGADTPLVWFEGSSMGTASANYLISDRQGSIIATAPDSGAAATPAIYDPYGVPGSWAAIGSASRFQYTGQIAIPEAQLYDYKARVYDPVSGRFLQTDPVGYGPDVNWYAYVGNDPANNGDPTGEALVEFRFNPIPLTVFIASHIVVVITDKTTGQQTYFRGGPTGVGIPNWGELRGEHGAFIPGSKDYLSNPRGRQVVIDDEKPASGYINKAMDFENRSNAEHTSYDPLRINSNSYAEKIGGKSFWKTTRR